MISLSHRASRSGASSRGTRIAFATLALLVFHAGLAGQTIRDPEVVDLVFEGNSAYSDGDLAAAIRTRQTECASFLLEPFCLLTNWGFAHRRNYLSDRDLQDDRNRVEVFYKLRGYLAVSVDTVVARSDGDARVTFQVEEGEPTPIDSFTVVGLEGVLDSTRIREIIGLTIGDPFDQVRLELGRDSLQRELRDTGYLSVFILEDYFVPFGEGARVTLDVTPGVRYRVGQTHVEGAEAIGDRTIRRLLNVVSGEYYSQRRVEEGQRTLFSLDAVRFASVQPELSGDSVVDLRVQITPANPRGARGGGGWSTDECFQTEARLTHRNLLGGAKRLELTARLKNIFAQQLEGAFPCSDVGQDPAFRSLNFLLQAELTVPVFFSGRNSLRGLLFAERESVPDVFIRQGVGAQMSISRRLRSRMTATVSYRPEFTGFDEESADIYFCVNFGFCAPDDIEVVSQARWLSPVTLSWVYNHTNDPFAPTSGYYLSAEVERAANFTGSDYEYVRLAFQAADFETLDRGLVFGARLRAGVVEATSGTLFSSAREVTEEVIHPSKRFFAGGSQSVRGFGQNLLGPRVLVADAVQDCPDEPLPECVGRLASESPGSFVERPIGGNAAFELSLELRKLLSSRWGVVAFLDAGQVWDGLSSITAPIWTPGVGLRYLSPVGPLRLDIGYNPSRAAQLPVVVSLQDGQLLELDSPVRFDPFNFDDPSGATEFLRRLQFHFSIGEAF
jgi:outer membrane protein insertion porin family/translocation and assembly module TamA